RLRPRPVTANARVGFHDAGDLDASLEREARGVQTERARAEHDDAPRGEGSIPREQRGGAAGAERARALPARKAEQDVPRAGRDDQAVVAEQPRAAVVREPEPP